MPGTNFRKTVIWMGTRPLTMKLPEIVNIICALFEEFMDVPVVKGLLIQFHPPPSQEMLIDHEYILLELEKIRMEIPCRILYDLQDIRYFTFQPSVNLYQSPNLHIVQIASIIN